MVKKMYAGLGQEYVLCLFRFKMGITGFCAIYMLEGYPPIQTRNPYRMVPISSLGPILVLKCLLVIASILASSVRSVRMDRRSRLLFVFRGFYSVVCGPLARFLSL